MRPKKSLSLVTTYQNLPKVIAECIVASFGLFFTGYQMSAVDDMKTSLASAFNWNTHTANNKIILFNTVFLAAAPAGSLFAGFFSSSIGRKKTMIFSDFLGLIGIGMSLVVSDELFFGVSRAFVGISAGINVIVVPIFIFEMLPREVYHKYGPTNHISFTLGFVVSRLVATLIYLGFTNDNLPSTQNSLWRIILGIPLVFILIRCMIYIFFWEKDTAKFYVFKHQDRDASDVLNTFYKKEWILAKTRELVSIRNDQSQNNSEPRFRNMVNKKYGNRTFVCLGIATFKQLGAVNAFLFYKSDALVDDEILQNYKDIVIVIWAVGAAVASIATPFFLRVWGKKKLLLFGSAIMTIMTSFIIISYFESIPIAPQVAVFLYTLAYSFSFGPLSWMFYCQLLPDKGVSVIKIYEWILNILLVWLIRPTYNESDFYIEANNLLILFLIISAFGFFFIMQFVREIKGKDYFAIKRNFEADDDDERVKEVFLRNRPSIFD